jgi:alpha-1,6-mannosyltransferase
MLGPARPQAQARFVRAQAIAVPLSLFVIGAAMLGLGWWAGDLHRFTQWIAGYIELFIAELAMCVLACGVIWKWNHNSSRTARWITLGIILFFALALRLTMVLEEPYLSSDVYRYAWDAHVQAHGINPYLYAPDAPQLDDLRDENRYPDVREIYGYMNRKNLPTPYPPGAQIVFFVVGWIHPLSDRAFKTAEMFFDGVTILALMWGLARSRLDPARAILFAWHPLPIWEGSHSGHLEGAFMMMLALALLTWAYRRNALTGVMLGLAAAIKYYPALVLPAFLRSNKNENDGAPEREPQKTSILDALRATITNKSNYVMLGAFVLTIAVVYLPYVLSGSTGFGSLNNEFNEEGFTGTGARYFILAVLHQIAPVSTPLFLFAGVALLLLLGSWWAIHRKVSAFDVARGAATLIGVYWLLVSPRYAWYYAWILPFLCFAPRLGWLYLTGASIFMYFTWYINVYPDLPLLLGASVYVPAVAWLIWEKVREKRAGGESPMPLS